MKRFSLFFLIFFVFIILVSCGGETSTVSPSKRSKGPGAPPLPGAENSGTPVGQVYLATGAVPGGAASWGAAPVDVFTDADLVTITDESFAEGADAQTMTVTVTMEDGLVYEQLHFFGKNGWRSEPFLLGEDDERWPGWFSGKADVQIEIPRDELNIDGENFFSFFACKLNENDVDVDLDDSLKCVCREEDDCTTWNITDDWSTRIYWFTYVFYATDDSDDDERACTAVDGTWMEESQPFCCGDDDEEYPNSQQNSLCTVLDAPEPIPCSPVDSNSDIVCCPEEMCVYEGECYTNGEVIDDDGDGKYDSYCSTRVWSDIDADTEVCDVYDLTPLKSGETVDHGEYNSDLRRNTVMCCGDDADEHAITGDDGTSACCDAENDVVDASSCGAAEVETPQTPGEGVSIDANGRLMILKDVNILLNVPYSEYRLGDLIKGIIDKGTNCNYIYPIPSKPFSGHAQNVLYWTLLGDLVYDQSAYDGSSPKRVYGAVSDHDTPKLKDIGMFQIKHCQSPGTTVIWDLPS